MTTRTLAAVAAAVLVFLAGCVGAGSPSVATQTGETESTNDSGSPTVTVGASASVEAAPDLAVVRVAVEATADSAEEARSAVAADAERMRAALREAGVPDENVNTEAFNVYPQHDYDGETRELVGYRAVHAYRVGVAPDRAGEAVDTAVGNGATSVYGVSFELSEEARQELREEALTLAVENARADAETVAAASGASLGDVRSISTSDGGDGGPIPLAESRSADGASTVVEPGTVRVSASVTVVYDLA